MNQEPHPDHLTAWQQAKEIRRGSMAVLEDRAIKAYHNALEQGKSRDEAEKLYFETFTKFYDGKE